MDEVGARLRQVLEAQPTLRARALVLLAVVEPRSLGELADLLRCERHELMPALGPCVAEELVRFSRVDGDDAVHWYATAKGRQVGDDLYRRTHSRLPEAPALEPLAEEATPPVPAPRTRPQLGRRRRVVIGQEHEQPSERAYSFGE